MDKFYQVKGHLIYSWMLNLIVAFWHPFESHCTSIILKITILSVVYQLLDVKIISYTGVDILFDLQS